MQHIAKREKGFTLIEVVIVIAIAAALIAIVLLAVTGAQRAQRDQTRKSDAGRIAAMLEQYASNNGGKYPPSGDLFNLTTGPLRNYDQNLAEKYAGMNKTASDCATMPSSASYYIYTPVGTRDYKLAYCSENAKDDIEIKK